MIPTPQTIDFTPNPLLRSRLEFCGAPTTIRGIDILTTRPVEVGDALVYARITVGKTTCYVAAYEPETGNMVIHDGANWKAVNVEIFYGLNQPVEYSEFTPRLLEVDK